jgi:hypothetical protein
MHGPARCRFSAGFASAGAAGCSSISWMSRVHAATLDNEIPSPARSP